MKCPSSRVTDFLIVVVNVDEAGLRPAFDLTGAPPPTLTPLQRVSPSGDAPPPLTPPPRAAGDTTPCKVTPVILHGVIFFLQSTR